MVECCVWLGKGCVELFEVIDIGCICYVMWGIDVFVFVLLDWVISLS